MLAKKLKIQLLKKYTTVLQFKWFLNKNFVLFSFLKNIFQIKNILHKLKIYNFERSKKNVFYNLLKINQFHLKKNHFGNAFLFPFRRKQNLDAFFLNIQETHGCYISGYQYNSFCSSSKSVFFILNTTKSESFFYCLLVAVKYLLKFVIFFFFFYKILWNIFLNLR